MKVSRTFAAALIALYLMGGGLGVPCALCFTTEGHFSLETSTETCGCCRSQPASPASSPAEEHGGGWESGPCPSCVDIPLSTASELPALGHRQAKEEPVKPRPSGPVPAFSFLPVVARHLLSGSLDGPPAPGILAQLRTVILRR